MNPAQRTAWTPRRHCWTADEARAFLAAAKAAGPQWAAFYGLALDSGARKGELCGLRWTDVDLDAGKIAITQQLTKPGPEPAFQGRRHTCATLLLHGSRLTES